MDYYCDWNTQLLDIACYEINWKIMKNNSDWNGLVFDMYSKDTTLPNVFTVSIKAICLLYNYYSYVYIKCETNVLPLFLFDIYYTDVFDYILLRSNDNFKCQKCFQFKNVYGV